MRRREGRRLRLVQRHMREGRRDRKQRRPKSYKCARHNRVWWRDAAKGLRNCEWSYGVEVQSRCWEWWASRPIEWNRYRSAAFIYLDSVLTKSLRQQIVTDIIPAGASTNIEAISTLSDRIPQGAFAECSLLFPLFVAGSRADNAGQASLVRNRLAAINNWRRFTNVDACIDVLDEIWEVNGSGAVAWQDVSKHRGWNLALFWGLYICFIFDHSLCSLAVQRHLVCHNDPLHRGHAYKQLCLRYRYQQ